MLNALDADGSGTISLDEFMAYFAEEPGDDDDYHKAQEESLQQDELYPSWVA